MLIESFIVKRLQKHWRGPAFTLNVEPRAYLIGKGDNQFSVTLKNSRILINIGISPSLGFGEAYMNGDARIEGDIMKFFEGFEHSPGLIPAPIQMIKRWLRYLPLSTKQGVDNAHHHYDIGNDFYGLWLDSTRTYTCAYFLKNEDSLEDAQYQKNDLV